jgi:replicative DNA helicase
MSAQPLVTPHTIEAEVAVLGGILINDTRLFEVVDVLDAGDFYRDAHQKIYRVILELSSEGGAVDLVTVQERLKRKGLLEDVGGPMYLSGLTSGMPRSTNVAHYARIVKESATRSGLINAANRILTDAAQADEDARTLLDKAEGLIFQLSQSAVTGDFVDAAQLVSEGIPAVESLLETKKGATGVSTGFADLDEMTRGLQPGSLALLAARPSMGKTALALNLAYNVAAAGKVVGFFSVEMARQELFMRLLASVSKIDGHRLQHGYVSQGDYTRMSDGFSRIANTGLCVDDSSVLSVLDIRGKARRLKARKGLDLVVIDYLQLMQLPKAENRNLAVADVSRALKLVARELNVPVLALSQLSRGLEGRGDKKPMLSDLRDSGALEQDADLVMFIHREEVYSPTPENAGCAELIIAKQRNGPTGNVKLVWHREQTRFDTKVSA